MITKNPDVSARRGLAGESVGIITLGCARNTVDSEKILVDAKRRGAKITSVERASTVFVNTCAFTKEAKEESIETILDLVDLKKRGRVRRIVVYGCLSERYEKDLKREFSEVDAFEGIADFKAADESAVRLTPRHYAYLKIAEGCANACSFCAIPAIKGPLRSRRAGAIIEEAKRLQDEGVKELNIIGQDITLYGQEGRPQGRRCGPLVGLLGKILKETQIPWVRLLYLYPLRISDDLLDLMASQERLCPYIDVPLQHAGERILKRMRRGMTKAEIFCLLENIRRKLPRAALRTTFIVGFPSETERDFEELCAFARRARFDKLGVFKYSREENTAAYALRGHKSEAVKQARFDRLMSLQGEISSDLLSRRRGEVTQVLVDEVSAPGLEPPVGRSRWEAPEVDGVIYLKSGRRLKSGSFVTCRITDSFEYDLVGEVLS